MSHNNTHNNNDTVENQLRGVIEWFRKLNDTPGSSTFGYNENYRFVLEPDAFTKKENWTQLYHGIGIFERKNEYAIIVVGMHDNPRKIFYIARAANHYVITGLNYKHTTNDLHFVAEILNELFGGGPSRTLHPPPMTVFHHHHVQSQPQNSSSNNNKKLVGLFAATAASLVAAHAARKPATELATKAIHSEKGQKILLAAKAAAAGGGNKANNNNKAMIDPKLGHLMNLGMAFAKNDHIGAYHATANVVGHRQALSMSKDFATGNHVGLLKKIGSEMEKAINLRTNSR